MHPDNIGQQFTPKLYHWGNSKINEGDIVRPTHSLRESAELMDEGSDGWDEEGWCEHGGSHDHIDPTPQAWASPDPDYYRESGMHLHEVVPVNPKDLIHEPWDDGTPEVASKAGFRVVRYLGQEK